MNRKLLHLFFALLVSVLLSSCTASLTETYLGKVQRPSIELAFFRQLDREVKAAKVTHMTYTAIAGFPYLRTNRYYAALKNRLTTPERKNEWLQALQQLDLEGRANEIQNLPLPVVERINRQHGIEGQDLRTGLMRMVREFSDSLLQYDQQQAGFFPALISVVKVPDDYSIWMRTFGLYPLFVPPVAYFTDGAFDKMRELNQQPIAEQKVFGKIVAYSPPATETNRFALIRRIYQPSNRDAFGLPKLSAVDREQLAHIYAPVINQDVAESFDQLGAVVWSEHKLEIDAGNPVVYYYFSGAFQRGEPIWQINYVFWTSGRLGPNAPFIERGKLDGSTIRVSLDQEGYPLLVDGINNCGCYHFFVPRKDHLVRVIPVAFDFDPVVIDFLPEAFPDKPLTVRITSGRHQVADVGSELPADTFQPYNLLPYERLESIPRSQDEFASMFDEEGIAIDSDRIEIYLLFAMGIRRIGAMRQRGHHPTKLIDRAHFDDPALIDTNFEFK